MSWGYAAAGVWLLLCAFLIVVLCSAAKIRDIQREAAFDAHVRRTPGLVDPQRETALAAIRAEETNPARPDWARVPDHAPHLVRDLELMVAEQRTPDGGAA